MAGRMCRVFVRKELCNVSQATRAENVLLLLIESGAVYLEGWIVVVILVLVPSTGLAYLYGAEFAPYIMVLYPVIVILLVTCRDVPCVTAFRDGPPVAPSRCTFIEPTLDSSPTPVIHIGFNEASRSEAGSRDIPSLTVQYSS
ncbi:hypothetical protein C8J56DRAFT_1090395 [Mycena floridula]|nr:hypothetical protein C8J56DRAFT_1090395 [Mycena floridula]